MHIKSYAVLLVALLLLGTLYPATTSAKYTTLVQEKQGKTKAKLVALTFDDGPDPLYTKEIMAVLKQYQIPATFFVVGEIAKEHPEILRQEVAEGHELANHTYTHIKMLDMAQAPDQKEMLQEISATNDFLESITGKKIKFFRPPWGKYTPEQQELIQSLGMEIVLWNICVENSHATTPEKMADRVIKAAKPNMIILAHDGRLDRSRTVAALPLIIESLQNQNYTFVTLTDLYEAENQQAS